MPFRRFKVIDILKSPINLWECNSNSFACVIYSSGLNYSLKIGREQY